MMAAIKIDFAFFTRNGTWYTFVIDAAVNFFFAFSTRNIVTFSV